MVHLPGGVYGLDRTQWRNSMLLSDDDPIKLFVHWLYRNKIKSPPDSLSELAREAGCSKAEVSAGIAEAERVLDQVQPALDAGLIEFDDRAGFRLTAKGKQLPP